jgi:hypothetical protein
MTLRTEGTLLSESRAGIGTVAEDSVTAEVDE